MKKKRFFFIEKKFILIFHMMRQSHKHIKIYDIDTV